MIFKKRFAPVLVLAVVVILIFSTLVFLQQKSVISQESKKPTHLVKVKISSKEAKQIITNRAKEIITALKTKDMKKLSTFVHPDKGVRFSPYSYVDLKNDLVFKSSHIKNILADTTKYSWGFEDATGDDIKLTFPRYFKRFVYDHDFANAQKISYQKIIGRGNTVNNNFEIYPKAIIVEYHFPGFNPAYHGMDWKSLRFVFEKKGETWYLIGIIHDQWTS